MAKKLTYEEVKHFIEIKSSSGCKLISEKYLGYNEVLKLQCRCGRVYNTSYKTFRQGFHHICKVCSGREYDTQYLLDYLKTENGNGCELISKEYHSSKELLEFRCECGNIFKTSFNSFLHSNQRQCPECGRSRAAKSFMLDIEDVEQYINKNTPFKLKSNEYFGYDEPLKLECPSCNSTFESTFNRVKYGGIISCNDCSLKLRGESSRLGYNNIKSFIEGESECKLLTDSKNILSNDIINIRCFCGEVFKTTYSAFRYSNKRQCNDCGHKILGLKLRKSHTEFIQDVKNTFGDEYTVIGEYIKTGIKVEIQHNKCGYKWHVEPCSFLGKGRRCPRCNMSKGEAFILNYLEESVVNFDTEYSFDGLFGEGGGLLRFDFALFDQNDNVGCLIEYDGEFHFNKYYENQNFEVAKIHDKRKNQYCIDNGIPLLRIPYWEFDNIKTILDNWLSKFNLVHK